MNPCLKQLRIIEEAALASNRGWIFSLISQFSSNLHSFLSQLSLIMVFRHLALLSLAISLQSILAIPASAGFEFLETLSKEQVQLRNKHALRFNNLPWKHKVGIGAGLIGLATARAVAFWGGVIAGPIVAGVYHRKNKNLRLRNAELEALMGSGSESDD